MSALSMNEAVKQAVKAAGGASKVAREVSKLLDLDKPLTPQAVQKWEKKVCPPRHVIALESLQAEVSRFQLRPDIYPKEKTPLRN